MKIPFFVAACFNTIRFERRGHCQWWLARHNGRVVGVSTPGIPKASVLR
jgi:hypothetical protein